jgi:hypothetical protein
VTDVQRWYRALREQGRRHQAACDAIARRLGVDAATARLVLKRAERVHGPTFPEERPS